MMMGIIFPHHLPCTLGKAKKNPEETQGNKRDFRVVSVCC